MKNEIQAAEQAQMITPAGTIPQAVEQFNLYQQLKNELGRPEDFQTFWAKEKKNGKYERVQKSFPKKSFVRKVRRFFNISCKILHEEGLKDENGKLFAWVVTARATHQATGTYEDGDGSCTFEEKKEKGSPATFHNVRSHAVTRAKNRAILDLVGFGDVSAEEINAGEYDSNPQQPTEAERKVNGLQAMSTEANKKKLTQEERAAIIAAETNKKNDTDLTLNEIISMYNFFKDTSAKVLKETAQTLLQPQDKKKIYDVDPETGEATEVIEMRDNNVK